MKLTGKAKEDFYNKTLYTEINFDLVGELFQNALIIEFFDSVGIKIFPYPIINSEDFDAVIQHENMYQAIDVRLSRQEAINAAIEKANEIYNKEK